MEPCKERTMTSTQRRNFLLTMGLAGGITATGPAAWIPQARPAARDVKPAQGYRASAHIQKYYRTTQV
jgi:hypothetical protein